ncbi:hypothetical protein [Streptomyces albiflavescens]|uniref:hypothetical protein n=1 Tax=Streptomyces albiflavescens TaxID=1623582 RepID=UPI001E302BDE|nr:hypothetical protein [Streptomyces albiflavescens]
MVLRGVLELLAGSVLIVVACNYRNLASWVWGWWDVVSDPGKFRWKTPERMRIAFGIAGVVIAVVGLATVTR